MGQILTRKLRWGLWGVWITLLPPRSPSRTSLGRCSHVLRHCWLWALLLQLDPGWSLLKSVVGLDRVLARLILTWSEHLPACMLTQILKVERFINDSILQQCSLFNWGSRCTWNLQVKHWLDEDLQVIQRMPISRQLLSDWPWSACPLV